MSQVLKSEQWVITDKLPVLMARMDKINERLRMSSAPLLTISVEPLGVRTMRKGLQEITADFSKVRIERQIADDVNHTKVLAHTRIALSTGVMTHTFYDDLNEEQVYAIQNPASACKCDHCNHDRQRVNIYTVQNDQGIFRVGSSCIDDFSKLKMNKWLAAHEDAVEQLNKYSEITFSDIRDHGVLEVDSLLAEVVELLQKGPYQTKYEHGISTGYIAFGNVQLKVEQNDGRAPEYPDDVMESVRLIKQMILQSEFSETERLKDISLSQRNIVNNGYVTVAQAPIMAGAVAWHNKHKKLQAEREAEGSAPKAQSNVGTAHLGAVKDRIVFKNLQVVGVWAGTSDRGFPFTKLTMLDDQNHVITWKASTHLDLDKGDRINLVGSVKGHATFNSKLFGKEVQATEMTRCSILTNEEVLEAEKPKKARTRKAQEESLSPAA
ncbi:hypothetical protein HNP46_000077 [Pseudomonas nitritireducens]|uniref:Uncharacterized protein n=1 Tax=Pseudomonas nitroreducens TaxID=46680 RepID=A0A7W7KEA8_PSENT|nr:hypothetical protein [Pseudomonas nitritireducens]MBB4861266.1 hypothetical protein [Pseudomonas nitritireducens]